MPKKQTVVLNDSDWAKVLETAYEEYMWQCEASVDGEEDDNFSTLSGQPFCGCSTCYTREQLFFLIPQIIEGLKEKKIEMVDTDEE
jgi:hypothetical protein